MHAGTRCQRLNDQRRCHAPVEDLNRGNIPLVLGIVRTDFRPLPGAAHVVMCVQQAVEGLSVARASLERPFAGLERRWKLHKKGRNMARKERVSFTIDPELFDQFATYAEENDLDISDAYREALQEYAYIKMPSSDAEAEFAVMHAKVEAKRASGESIASLPALSIASLPN